MLVVAVIAVMLLFIMNHRRSGAIYSMGLIHDVNAAGLRQWQC